MYSNKSDVLIPFREFMDQNKSLNNALSLEVKNHHNLIFNIKNVQKLKQDKLKDFQALRFKFKVFEFFFVNFDKFLTNIFTKTLQICYLFPAIPRP